MVDKSATRTEELAALAQALSENERLAMAALLSGDLGDAEKRMKLAELFMRQWRMKMDMDRDLQARATRPKPVNEMSEAELRHELGRLLGIETKADPCKGERDASDRSGEGAGASQLPPEDASGAGSAG